MEIEALKSPKKGRYSEKYGKSLQHYPTFSLHRLLKSKIKRKFAGLYI
jgi:hypothetical protein